MLQPSSITALLAQLIHTESDAVSAKPHTALLSLVDTSELYAFATRLSESPTAAAKSTVAAVLADTAAASGSSKPRNPLRRLSGLSLDERMTCLSAIAVASWRQAVKSPKSDVSFIANAGTKVSVSVAQHAVAGLPLSTGGKATSQELVPLLLECELGRLLVMPIVPTVPQMSTSRAELAGAEHSHDDPSPMYADAQKPFMLLTLNADLVGAPQSIPKSPIGSATAPMSQSTLSTTQTTRSRLRSGGNTPTSFSSDATATPLRSPMSEQLPSEDHAELTSAKATDTSEDEAVNTAWEQLVWSGLFGQAKAFARMMAPSLTKCGVGVHHDDDHAAVDDRRSGHISEDDVDEPH